MGHLLDRIPLGWLVLGALLFGLAPFVPEPHLWQKLKMLAHGDLSRPIDVFDLIMHAALPVLLMAKLGRVFVAANVKMRRSRLRVPRARVRERCGKGTGHGATGFFMLRGDETRRDRLGTGLSTRSEILSIPYRF
jgi:hypothetical protein